MVLLSEIQKTWIERVKKRTGCRCYMCIQFVHRVYNEYSIKEEQKNVQKNVAL
jgi:hypothetical protein